MEQKESKKYGYLAKEIGIRENVGSIEKCAVLDKSFFGWDSFSIRCGLIGQTGMITEESDKLHTHDYDQILWFLSADPGNMLELGAQLEIDLGAGAGGVRQRMSTPSVVLIPAGTPHFSPVVTDLEKKFFFLSVNCSGELRANVYDEKAKPGEDFGAWGEFRNEYKKNIQSLKFARKDPYHYGSALASDAGGIYTHVDAGSAAVPIPVSMSWQTVTKAHQLGPRRPDLTYAPHSHTYDEALIFLSLDLDDLTELHVEAEFGFGIQGEDQEFFTITKAAAMLAPEGVYHLPLVFRKVEKPMILITLSVNTGHTAPKQIG